jgi:hypothetical protein
MPSPTALRRDHESFAQGATSAPAVWQGILWLLRGRFAGEHAAAAARARCDREARRAKAGWVYGCCRSRGLLWFGVMLLHSWDVF